MKIAFVLYDRFTALDVVGPYEVLSRWPGAEVHFLATSTGPVRADAGLTVVPDVTPADLPDPDVLLVGGSSAPLGPLEDEALIEWVRQAAPGARWTCSVCTGSAVLAAAGVLEGRRATTHWGFRPFLAEMGVEVVTDRVVFDGDVVTAAGVSAGIDMALSLTAREFGDADARAAQLAIEYDPAPPFDAGSPETAGAEAMHRAGEILAGAA